MKPQIPLIFILLSILGGCSRHKTLDPYKWRALGNPSDSIMLTLENLFNNNVADSAINRAVAEFGLEISAMTDDAMKRCMAARLYYWEARLALKNGESDSAISLLDRAVGLNDSSAYTYDRMRFDNLRIPLSNPMGSPKAYLFYQRSLDYARDAGDWTLEARACINIGNLLAQVGELDDALRYYNTADSLNRELGLYTSIIKNRINRAGVIKSLGDRDSATALLRSVISDSACYNDGGTRDMVLRNLFIETDSIEYLRMTAPQPDRELASFHDGMMALWFYRHGLPDSASVYSGRSAGNLPFMKNPNYKAIVLLARSLVMMHEGLADSAYVYRVAYESQRDSALAISRSSDVVRLNVLREIKLAEARHMAQIYKRNMMLGALAFIFVLAATIMALWVVRRNARQKIEAVKMELELSRALRKSAAAAATIENQERVLSVAKDSLANMRRTGNISDSESRRLEKEIKMVLSQSEENSFDMAMHDLLHPEFFNRLNEICPGLDHSYLKIAAYVMLGLDNKRIAGLMNIRPESVRQSKWRLRQRLAVPKETTLDGFLRACNTEAVP